MTDVPDYWIAFLPTKEKLNAPDVRLKEGTILKDKSGRPMLIQGLGRLLEPSKTLSIYEEEIPRSGIQVMRAYQYARWIDGSTHVWMGRQKKIGRGEGTSELRFDAIE